MGEGAGWHVAPPAVPTFGLNSDTLSFLVSKYYRECACDVAIAGPGAGLFRGARAHHHPGGAGGAPRSPVRRLRRQASRRSQPRPGVTFRLFGKGGRGGEGSTARWHCDLHITPRAACLWDWNPCDACPRDGRWQWVAGAPGDAEGRQPGGRQGPAPRAAGARRLPPPTRSTRPACVGGPRGCCW